MKTRIQAPLILIVSTLLLISLACSIPTSLDTSPIQGLIDSVAGEVIDTVTQPQADPDQGGLQVLSQVVGKLKVRANWLQLLRE